MEDTVKKILELKKKFSQIGSRAMIVPYKPDTRLFGESPLMVAVSSDERGEYFDVSGVWNDVKNLEINEIDAEKSKLTLETGKKNKFVCGVKNDRLYVKKSGPIESVLDGLKLKNALGKNSALLTAF